MKATVLVRAAVLTLSVALVPVLPGEVWAAEPPAGVPEAACSCSAAFDQAIASVEADYAGFQLKVEAERREAYDRFKALQRKDAASAGADRCKEVLDTYLWFFQDYHLFALRYGKAGETAKSTARPWTEAGARAEIDRHRERLDPVEGLWYSQAGRYAVLHEAGAPAGSFFAVRLNGDGSPSTELVALLRRTARGTYQALLRDAQGLWQNRGADLYRGGALLSFGFQSWGRLHPAAPESRLDPADPQAPLFARLDAKTLYLSLPSFSGEYRQPLADLLEARGAEIGKAEGLIIDLRGNGGGDLIYAGLVPYIFTGSFEYQQDNLILASPRNLRELEAIRAPLGEGGAEFDPALRRMRENPGKLVPFRDAMSYTPPVLSPGPRRVVLLVDRAVASAAEAMVLWSRQSPRVTVVGENTRGNIDYQQVILNSIGCGDHTYALGIPLYTRTRQLPEGALDLLGIAPDIPLSEDLADPLALAVRLLAEG